MKNKKNQLDITNDILIANMMLRITAMEKLLINKAIFTQEELLKITDYFSQKVANMVLEKAKTSNTLEELISSLESSAKEDKK